MIQSQRLIDRFCKYVSCGSESRNERDFCLLLEQELTSMGVPFFRDTVAGEQCGSNGWNLQCFLPGEGEPILLSSHMDTVPPGEHIVPVIEDGVIRSQGETVLGSDDKSGVAAIMEALETVIEEACPHRPVEVLFSICEEQGLLGSKYADFSHYHSKEAVVMDSSKNGCIINRSTDNATISVRIHGKSAHAASAPEEGIHAVKAMARAIDQIPCGRVDQDTVINVSIVSAPGKANVIPDYAEFTIMLRSFSTERQSYWLETMENTIHSACDAFGASYEFTLIKSYPGIHADPSLPIIQKLKTIYQNMGVELELASGFGGCDATWIAAQGIDVVNIGTGMSQIHSIDEYIRIEDLERTCRAAYALMQL